MSLTALFLNVSNSNYFPLLFIFTLIVNVSILQMFMFGELAFDNWLARDSPRKNGGLCAPWLCEEVRQRACKDHNVESKRKWRNENRLRIQYSPENNIGEIGGQGEINNLSWKLLGPL